MSAADVKPAIAAKSASYACTSDPIANPKFVLAAEAFDAPVPPSAILKSVIPDIVPPLIFVVVSIELFNVIIPVESAIEPAAVPSFAFKLLTFKLFAVNTVTGLFDPIVQSVILLERSSGIYSKRIK